MARISLFGTGTVGVDLRSNPLSLGNTRLRSATNIQFHEGVVKTRPGLVLTPIGKSGCLQGACRYAPSSGLSSQQFGPAVSGISFVCDGDIFFNSGNTTRQVTSNKPFCNLGPVSLYQAENWLIAQNPAGTTIMWDGLGDPVESPGTVEVYWDDADTPWEEALPVNPVADIPDCEPGSQPWWVKFTVLDIETLLPVPSAVWSIRRLSQTAFNGVTPADGSFTITPAEREYFYNVSASGYYPIENVRTTFRRPRNAENRDDCYQANAENRELLRVVLLTPLTEGWTPGTPPPPPSEGCDYSLAIVGRLYPCDDPFTHESYLLQLLVSNNSSTALTITGATLVSSPVALHAFTVGVADEVNGTQPLPVTVNHGESVILDVLAVPSTAVHSGVCGLEFNLSTSCGTSNNITW